MKIKIQHMDIVKHPALLVIKNQDFFTILGIVGNCFFSWVMVARLCLMSSCCANELDCLFVVLNVFF